MESDHDNDIIQTQAVGRISEIGMLYDCRSDALITNIKLWSKEKIQKNLIIKNEATQSVKIETSDSLSVKASLLNIDSSLKLSFLGGLLLDAGSTKYLNDRISLSHQERVSLRYQYTTKLEHLNIQALADEKIDYTDVFDKQEATHVITGIQYGTQVVFLFDKQHNDGNAKKKNEWGIKEIVKSISSLQTKGSDSLELEDDQKEVCKSINCTYYGEFKPKTNPTTLEEVIQVYKQLNQFDNENGEPLLMYLYPLEKLNSRAAKFDREVSENLISQVETIFESFQEIFIRCNDLSKQATFLKLSNCKRSLENFMLLIKQEQLEFQKKIGSILPKIRGGFAEESVLADVILELYESPFSSMKLSEWLNEKEGQLKEITTIYNSMEEIQFVSEGELETYILNPENQHVLCFMLKIPDSDDQMVSMQNYVSSSPFSDMKEPASEIIKLLDEKEVNQPMQTTECTKLFSAFHNTNKNRITDSKNKTLFLISEISSNLKELSGTIYYYRLGKLINTMFLPPSPPENIEIVKINHDSVVLKWDPSNASTEDIVTYEIEYQTVLEEPDNETKVIKSTDESLTEFVLSHLSPATAYQFRIRSAVPSGVSTFCDLSISVITMPSSPPKVKKVSQVDDKTVQIEFEEPTIMVENVIKCYHIFYKTNSDSSWEGPIEVDLDERNQKRLEVEVNETYIFKIRAIYDAEYHQELSSKESKYSRISPSIYVVDDLKEFLEKTAVFREDLENTAKKLSSFKSDSEFIHSCQQNLENLWENAKNVPEFWRQLLQENTFSKFFKMIIDNKDVYDDNDKIFIKHRLQELLNLAGDVEFCYSSDLNNWVKKQADSSENHEKALFDLYKGSNDLINSNEFLTNCKSFLDDVLEHARFAPVYWKTMLMEGKFTNFFSKLITCQDSLMSKQFIQLNLIQLIEIAKDTSFHHREDLICIAGEHEVNSTDQEEYIADDLPTFIALMNEKLLPTYQTKLDILIPETINLINNLLKNLPESEYLHQRYEGCILQSLLMKYDIFNASIDENFSSDYLRTLVDELGDCWSIFQEYGEKGAMECQALIFVLFIKYVESQPGDAAMISVDEAMMSYDIDTTRDKEKEFNNQVRIIGKDLIIEIQQIIDKWAKNSPFNWKALKEGFHSLEKGDKRILNKEEYVIEEIKSVENAQDYEKDKEIVPYCTSVSVDALSQFQYLNNLLENFKLTDFFPSKISLWDITKITKNKEYCDGQHKIQVTDIPWKILQKLIMINYTGRDSVFSELDANNGEGELNEENYFLDDMTDSSTGEAVSMNPLDAFLTTFLCCNPMLKQIIIGKMFTCKLAIPFIYPVSSISLGMSIWALRSIITEWRGKDKTAAEKSVIDCPLHIVSFRRIKRPSASKAKLINDVLNDQAHHTFFNQDSAQGMTEKKFCDGMIEASWFLPSGKETSTFSEVLMFLNLRGDCSKHKDQSKFLNIASTVDFIMVNAEDIDSDTSIESLKNVFKKSQEVVVILSSHANPPNKNIVKTAVLNVKELSTNNEKQNIKIIFGFKPDGRKSATDLKNEIRLVISERISKMPTLTITKCIPLAEKNGLHFFIDENDTAIKKGKKHADEVFQHIKDIPLDKCKKKMLPLQGETWQEWSKLLKQQHRVGGNKLKESSMEQKGKIGMDMVNLREKQLRICEHSSAMVFCFRANLMKLAEEGDSVIYFLQWLKIFLDEKSRNNLPELALRYKENWRKFREENKNAEAKQESLDQLRSEAENAERQLADASCGLEHLLRELTQMYETVVTNTNIPKKIRESFEKIPMAAAKLLLKGQPLEIMDGDAANVPLTWVKAVFESLRKCIGDKKLFVLSVLGIQSSGKSTLLNTMFGLQFAVSAGRCTRGVYMQLVPVDKERSSFQFDYVLVVDTEGLRAPELGQQKHDHDNELATLVIGLGDFTILNIKGENTAEVRDVLQIAVHAFLRMKVVNNKLKLRQSCLFLHQNVPAVNAKEKMEHGHRKLQEDLDEMTKEAAYQEKIVNIKSFNEVIEYDGEKHVFYFSDLWHGDPPMAPANSGYSENVEKLREWLLEEINVKQKTFYTVTDMKLRIEDLWNGVLADDFVFNFRNSLEIKAYRGLEDKFCHLIFSLEQEIGKWLKSPAEVEMSKCTTEEDLQQCHIILITRLSKEISNLGQKSYEELDTYFEENNLKDIIIQWKEQKRVALEMSINDVIMKARQEMHKIKESIQLDLYQREKEKVHEVEIRKKAEKLAGVLMNKETSDAYLGNEFNKLWIGWKKNLALKESTHKIPIEVVVDNLLYNYQKDIHVHLNQELKLKPISTDLNLKRLEESISFQDITSEYICVNSFFSSKSNECQTKSSWTSSALGVVNSAYDYLSGANKKKLNLLDNKYRELAVKVINQTLVKVDIYLANLFKQDTGFRDAYASEVINIIVKDIKKHNKAITEEYPFTFLPNLQAKITVHASVHAVKCFKKLENDYQEKHGIKAKLEAYKGKVWQIFINKVKKSSEEITAAALFWECLKEWIKKNVKKEMESGIPTDIIQEFSLKKYHLLLKILDSLADKGNFDNYEGYIMDAYSYAEKWIKEYIEEQHFAKVDLEHNSKYSLGAEIKIGSTMHNIQKAIEKATNTVTEEGSICTPEEKSVKMKVWISTFCAHLQDNNLPINDTVLGTLGNSNISNFINLQKHILKQLYDEQKTLGVYFKSITESTIGWEEKSPVNFIMEKLWGCPAQCPFCREPCLWMKNHEGQPHRCLQHRPQGVGGRFWLDSMKLVTENCNWMVNSTARKFVCTKRTWEEAYTEAQKVDLAFLVDATISMNHIITTIKEEIYNIIEKINNKYPDAQLRFAFVGYRDHCDEPDRIEVKNFTDNIHSFRTFVAGIRAMGGGDPPEDVFGGLEEAGKLSWTAENRVLVHFADYPCHGSRFHEISHCDDYKDYNKQDFRGLKIEDLIAKLLNLEIQYYFGKMTRHTDKMIEEFRRVSGDENFPRQMDASNASNVLTIVADSVTGTIHETMEEWQKKGSSGVVGDEDDDRKCKDVWHKYKNYKTCLPKWDIAPAQTAESSQYWQWFMYKYTDQIQKIHHAKLPDMPESWRTIDVEKAKESLRKNLI